MSTRGAVAWFVHSYPTAVYNQYDSYPHSLGKKIWGYAKELGLSGLIQLLKKYGDWEEFETGGVCEYCGKIAGVPQNIAVSELPCSRNEITGLYPYAPDPEVKYHKHGNSQRDQFDPFKEGLFMSWVYLLDEATNSIEIWMNAPQYRLYKYRNLGFVTSQEIDDSGYTHVLFRRISLREEEPNWEQLSVEAQQLKESIYGDGI